MRVWAPQWRSVCLWSAPPQRRPRGACVRHYSAARDDSLEAGRDSWTFTKERQTKSSGQHPRTTLNFRAVQRVLCIHLLSVKTAKSFSHFQFTIQPINVCLLLALHSVYILIVQNSVLMGYIIIISQERCWNVCFLRQEIFIYLFLTFTYLFILWVTNIPFLIFWSL